MRVYPRANPETGRVDLYSFETNKLVASMPPLDAYAHADAVTDAADKLLSEQPGQLATSPKTQ